MKKKLTICRLKKAATDFAEIESDHGEPALYGVTDGKAVGTYLEHKFRLFLAQNFTFEVGNSARGIDLPGLQVDMKTTSIRQPQSSCPFKSARQKIYGLGYALLVFVYDKSDDHAEKTSRLDIQHVIYVDADRTADYQMTRGINQILDNDGNEDDLVAFMNDKLLPIDNIEAVRIAGELLQNRPLTGYLTISNALQWRLQYKRVITKAGEVKGVYRLH
ncbi:MAG TPA: restriction endonuclease [Phycisphaerae bacterium]|nr:restriction endonuclease [Phycisphaerae bacterium]